MKAVLILMILIPFTLFSQEINLHLDRVEPNYGLAVTGTGMTLCMIGTTMRQPASLQYSPRHGSNYVSYTNDSNRVIRLSTMAIGTIITLTGLLIQNRKRKSS